MPREDYLMNDAIREARKRGESKDYRFYLPDNSDGRVIVPFSVFENAVKIANKKAYRPSKELEKSL